MVYYCSHHSFMHVSFKLYQKMRAAEAEQEKSTEIWKSFCRPSSVLFSSVQSFSCVRLFATPWIEALQTSLSITNSRSSLKFTSIKSVMPSNHLILCRPLLLLPLIPPSIRVFYYRTIALISHASKMPKILCQENWELEPRTSRCSSWI